jgi:hypothetical protein
MKQNEASRPVTYTPAVTAAGAAIALYLLNKIGKLFVILLLWAAYAALAYAVLHVVAAWLGVPLMALMRSSPVMLRKSARDGELYRWVKGTPVLRSRR